jgi:hypothetical protein
MCERDFSYQYLLCIAARYVLLMDYLYLLLNMKIFLSLFTPRRKKPNPKNN